ncbi:hypothetical protein FRC09_005521 [Ceratobasidium sp. 395]|nr:hypothetical protein FRC09_005521 [Ceratobasidium sp. 395]
MRFHCTDPWARRGHYESKIIPRAIAAALFYGKNSIGVLFHEYLNPIPIPALAFILTMIQFCLSEWDGTTKGVFKARKINELAQDDLQNMYSGHMENIRCYCTVGDAYLAELRALWFRYGIVYSGASIREHEDPLPNLIDVSEFHPPPPRMSQPLSPSQLYPPSNRRKRQRSPTANREPEAGPSAQRQRIDTSDSDHNMAIELEMAMYEADCEEYLAGELMDVDLRTDAESLHEPSEPEINEEGRYTTQAKGKNQS